MATAEREEKVNTKKARPNKNKRKKQTANTNEKKKNRPKSVPFSKAAKGRKPGTKGPIGFGMYPLD